MQPLAGVANKSGKAFLDIEVHVFQFQLPDELAAAYFFADLTQASFDRSQIIRIDNACAANIRA